MSAASDRPEVWIHKADQTTLDAQSANIERRRAAGEELPLAALTVAVKDNIDVAGMPTTAACPAFEYPAVTDASCVAALRAAGAIFVGKTNMDQFATGLVGTRSPYGAVRGAFDPLLVSGGSSSGSAVAVALGLCDLALGTDTAGSGRVPAAFQGIVGFKPSIGRIGNEGVVPACRSFDCVSVFAGSVAAAETAVAVMAGPNFADSVPTSGTKSAKFAVFGGQALSDLSPEYRSAYEAAVAAAIAAGDQLIEIDPAPFFEAGALLYGGAFVAERYAAVGEFIETHRSQTDPVVAEIILAGRSISAAAYVKDIQRLEGLKRAANAQLGDCDALVLPTAPFQPSIADVQADPFDINRRLGIYSSFGNLLDLCAIAIPSGRTETGSRFGITLYGRHGEDRTIATLARRLSGEVEPSASETPQALPDDRGAIELLVLGAHLRGQPLNDQLLERGATFIADAETAPGYRLFALDTTPPKPGLVRDGDSDGATGAGAAIAGELWAMPPHGLATLLAGLPSPMALGPVTLADGRTVVGFLCEPAALDGAEEITSFGGWRAYLER
ncbi:MAG: allophanate hydrolase [Solirubrobacteraceae bacterium]